MTALFPIIYEDDALLVINKPAGLVCHPTKQDLTSSLVGRIRLYLGTADATHLINRLDRETSGLVVAAKTSEASRSLRRVWAERQVTKEYQAIVHGHLAANTQTIDAPLGPDEVSEVVIKDCVREDGATAQTEIEVQERFHRAEGCFTLLAVRPHTGRKHQIRIHLAHIGHPLVGDKLYGADEALYLDFVKHRLTPEQENRLILPYQALHAGRLAFEWNDRVWEFTAPPEDGFRDFLHLSCARASGLSPLLDVPYGSLRE